jgi:hypothetical protein
MKHDYFKGGSFIRPVIYDLPRGEPLIRYVPWCTGVFRKHLRYIPYCLGVFRPQLWLTLRDNDCDFVEREETRLIFFWNNLWDQAVQLTTNSEQALFPASNTQHRWLSRCWFSKKGELDNIWLKVDLGESKNIRAFILSNHWFNPGTNLRIQANNVDVWGAPPLDETLEITDNKTIIMTRWQSYQNYRYWRVYMDAEDAGGLLTRERNISTRGNRDNVHYCNPYFKIGRIFLGDFFEVSQNYINRNPIYNEEIQPKKTIMGQEATVKTWKKRHFLYVFDKLSVGDSEEIWDIYNKLGTEVPFFVTQNYRYWWKRTYYVTFFDELKFEEIQKRADANLKLMEVR